MYNVKNKSYSIFELKRQLTFARCLIFVAGWIGFLLGMLCSGKLGGM